MSVHAVLEARSRRAVLGCPAVWLLFLASCHLPASQATELPCLNSSTGQVMSDSTLPLMDTGRAPGSQDRLRDISRPNGAESSDFCFLAPKADSGTGRGRHVRLREAGGLYHPPHPGIDHFLFSTRAKGCQYPVLLLPSPPCPPPHIAMWASSGTILGVLGPR